MNRPGASTRFALSDEQGTAASPRFHGYWLVLARMLWIVLAALILVLYVVGVLSAVLLIGVPLAIGAWIWGLVDAYQGAQAWNRAHGILS